MIKYCQKCGVIFQCKTPRQKYHSKRCQRNDRSAIKHFFPKYGKFAEAKYTLNRVHNKMIHGYENEDYLKYTQKKEERRMAYKDKKKLINRENQDLAKLQMIHLVNIMSKRQK